jgi:glycosyltransferase involved in cell wall biosynthesis
MRQKSITPRNTVFVVLCFEGPDGYSTAGGLGVRVDNLATTLARMGFSTHMFFIGDPDRPGEEAKERGKLILHRWCQWISKHHPNGVYDGEEHKLRDYNESIPRFVKDNIVKPAAAQGKLVVVLGEEWHTAEVMCRISDVLYQNGLRNNAVLFWNANNTFSFDRINWGRLSFTTTITTVSRYMKHTMWESGVNPLVVPNGIPKSLLGDVDARMVEEVRRALGSDLVLCKVARWDPDKRWNQAVQATAKLKQSGCRTTLLARGGMEPHRAEVMNNARSLGLSIKEAWAKDRSFESYLAAIREAATADIIDIRFQMPSEFLQVVYHAVDGVLANSGREPFGLVGLEAMAAGGIVFTGATGEDYAIPFVNSFVLETADPMEIVGHVLYLQDFPEEGARVRRAARATARYFTWEAAIENLVDKLENQARVQGALYGEPEPLPEEHFDPSKLPPELLPTGPKGAGGCRGGA